MASRDLTAFGYRRIVILIVALVIVPTALLLSMGVVLLFLRRVEFNIRPNYRRIRAASRRT